MPPRRAARTPTTCTRRSKSILTASTRYRETRGTTRFVEITQSHENIPNPSLEVPKDPPLRTTNDLDELTIGNDGTFSVILSAERPAGYDG